MNRDPVRRMEARRRTFLMVIAMATTVVILCTCGASQWFENLDWGQCQDYSSEYSTAFASHGTLLDAVPSETEPFAMALVLNSDAVNSLFRRLGDTRMPQLSESTEVLGQRLTASINPRIPVLQIGGQGSCANCIQAQVPFDLGVETSLVNLPRATGAISVQMPIRFVPQGDSKTALVAQFQSIEVLGLDLGLGQGVAANIFERLEPLVSHALTTFIRSRFTDATIVTLDSWKIGHGQVLLAGRGPIVHPEAGTLVIGMQSNLPIRTIARARAQAALPPGADIGLVIHPDLLGSMARRMLFEEVIPPAYDENGQPMSGGSTLFTLGQLDATSNGLLRASATLWRTGSMCGAADIAASIGLQATPQGISLAVQDIDVTNGRGSGQIFARADELASGFLNSLLQTLQFTINYDQIMGGERSEEPQMQTFQLNVDGGGVSLYLDLVD